MNANKKIAVIGGTGKAGKFLVNELVKAGFQIKMLVRNPDRIPAINSQIEVVIGDVLNQTVVSELLEDCNAVISTLGWGVPPSRHTISSEGTSNLLLAMKLHGITRYVVASGINVDAKGDKKGASVKAATEWMYANYPNSTADKQLEYEILNRNEVDWTLVRLPLITMDEENKPINASLEDCPGDQISATSLANFLMDQLSDRRFIKQAPFIANQ
ncbi:NAD(P)-dependent oxidoreductase [Algoriphagus persicinus]|uniref:NAD(P)-dependent oxidoreductase n=1 Tax=Algoriphagus persicinus TaxID=3108754 RepID=UPI002B364FEF|nr:NAD(P)H-binding protein [Algoriphagus sp. E1-3-M2]MEB2784112.1 NAD(P)H-binding protein [Algoriphagus sp. E1-3-M2]